MDGPPPPPPPPELLLLISSSSFPNYGKPPSFESQFSFTDMEAVDLLMQRAIGLLPPPYVYTDANPYTFDPDHLPLYRSTSDGGRRRIGYFYTYSHFIAGVGTPVRQKNLSGFWLESGQTVPICRENRMVGFRKDFVFRRRNIPKPEHSQEASSSSSSASAVAQGKWCSSEYRLITISLQRHLYPHHVFYQMERGVLIKIQLQPESGSSDQ